MGNFPQCLAVTHWNVHFRFGFPSHKQSKRKEGDGLKAEKKQSEAGLEPAIFSSGGKCLIIRPHGLLPFSS